MKKLLLLLTMCCFFLNQIGVAQSKSKTKAKSDTVTTKHAKPAPQKQPEPSKQNQSLPPKAKTEPAKTPKKLSKESMKHAEPKQTEEFHASFGIRAGGTISKLTGKDASDFTSRFGGLVGLLYYYPLNSTFSAQLEILYTMKGAVFQQNGSKRTILLDYIDVPLLVQYTPSVDLPVKPYFVAGPQCSFKMRAAVKSDTATNKLADVKSTDFSILIGAGARFELLGLPLAFDLRYNLGLASIHSAAANPLDLKNNMLNFSFVYYFQR